MPIKIEKPDNRKPGKRGLQGKQGIQGVRGVQGVQGLPGKDGINGIDGQNGVDGRDGSRWYDGKGAPDANLGDTGDFYLDNDTYDYYEKTTHWVKRGNLKGAKGDKGDKGDRGPRGYKGEDGGVGTPGADGAQGPQGPQGMTGAQGDPGVGVPTGGTTGQFLKKQSGTDYDTAWDNQQYSEIIYDSGATQENNVYNNATDFFNAIADMPVGKRVVTITEDLTVPTGAWNLDNVTLQGDNGLEYNSGGWTLTFGDNTTISSWIGSNFNGIRLLSTSTTGNICTFSIPIVVNCSKVSNVHSTTYPFFKFTGSGQMIVGLNDSARWTKLGGGVENLEVTSAAFACQLVVARGKGTTIEANTFKSTNSVVYIDVLQDAGQDPTTYPLTNSALSVGFLVVVNAVYSTTLNHIPVTKSADFTYTRAAEVYAVNASGGARTGSLPASSGSGIIYTTVKSDNSVNTVTVDAAGSDVINCLGAWGAGNYVLALQGNAVTMVDHAAGFWLVINSI
jgi:hypothetical protein